VRQTFRKKLELGFIWSNYQGEDGE